MIFPAFLLSVEFFEYFLWPFSLFDVRCRCDEQENIRKPRGRWAKGNHCRRSSLFSPPPTPRNLSPRWHNLYSEESERSKKLVNIKRVLCLFQVWLLGMRLWELNFHNIWNTPTGTNCCMYSRKVVQRKPFCVYCAYMSIQLAQKAALWLLLNYSDIPLSCLPLFHLDVSYTPLG